MEGDQYGETLTFNNLGHSSINGGIMLGVLVDTVKSPTALWNVIHKGINPIVKNEVEFAHG